MVGHKRSQKILSRKKKQQKTDVNKHFWDYNIVFTSPFSVIYLRKYELFSLNYISDQSKYSYYVKSTTIEIHDIYEDVKKKQNRLKKTQQNAWQQLQLFISFRGKGDGE